MATARALGSKDILQETLVHLRPDIEYQDFGDLQQVLAQCACVNRAFYECAVDLLWRQLDDILPLFKILPTFRSAEFSNDGFRSTTQYGLFGSLEPEDLHRFRLYARRIISLSVMKDSLSVPSYVLLTVFRALGHQPLLPRLQALYWDQSQVDDHDILLFISPSLRCLQLSNEMPDSTIISVDSVPCTFLSDTLCEQVAAAVPYLEKLHLYSNIAPYYFSPFAACRGLRQIYLRGDPMAGQSAHLIAFSCLEKLIALSVGNVEGLDQDAIPKFQGFLALEWLSVGGDSRSVGSVLMGFTPSLTSTLRELHITLRPRCDSPSAMDLMSVIKSQFGASLDEISVEDAPFHSGDPVAPPLQSIEPLLNIRNLRTVSLADASGPFCAFADDHLCTLLLAWPNITSLTLRWKTSSGMPRPSLRSLLLAAKSCLQLRDLHISFLDMTFKPSLDSVPIMSHGLTTLLIREGSSSDYKKTSTADVALFLDRLFPKLDTDMLGQWYSAFGKCDRHLDARRRKLREQLHLFQTVRAQEKRRVEEGHV